MIPIDGIVTEILLADDRRWFDLAERARTEARATRETRAERESLTVELLASWLHYYLTPKLDEHGFRSELVRRVGNEAVDWRVVATSLLDSLKTHYYRDGIPVTVIGAEGVRTGTLRGNTITVQNEGDAEDQDQGPSETRE